MPKPSVWNSIPPFRRGMQSESGRGMMAAGCTRYGYADALSRNGEGQHCQGNMPTTYRIMGSFWEQGNLTRALGPRNPASCQVQRRLGVRDGVSVVVGARESRAHGEGRQ